MDIGVCVGAIFCRPMMMLRQNLGPLDNSHPCGLRSSFGQSRQTEKLKVELDSGEAGLTCKGSIRLYSVYMLTQCVVILFFTLWFCFFSTNEDKLASLQGVLLPFDCLPGGPEVPLCSFHNLGA